jgi:hypothetical protein
MNTTGAKPGAIFDEKAQAVLSKLHAESKREWAKILWKYLPYYPRLLSGKKLPFPTHYWNKAQVLSKSDEWLY